ncbi:MAG: EthD family reductase [Betaproteobacteria bacterium]
MFTLFLFVDGALPAFAGTGRVYTPSQASDPYLGDGAPPASVVQLYFDSLQSLDDFVRKNEDLKCAAQAMAVRGCAVPQPGVGRCTYLVAYDGPAQDENAWHAHYLAHHPPIMAKLPGLRELVVYTRIDWVSPAAWKRLDCMQRNKVSFDSPEALTAALNSSVRHEMRADYAGLPKFSGRVTHFAMKTRVL